MRSYIPGVPKEQLKNQPKFHPPLNSHKKCIPQKSTFSIENTNNDLVPNNINNTKLIHPIPFKKTPSISLFAAKQTPYVSNQKFNSAVASR